MTPAGAPNSYSEEHDSISLTYVDWLAPLLQSPGGSRPNPPVPVPETQPGRDPVDTTAPIPIVGEDDFVRTERVVAVSPNPDRMVHRKLKGIHLFVSAPGSFTSILPWHGNY